MKTLVLTLIAGLFTFSAQAEPDDSTTVYRAHTDSVQEAQAVLDAINSGDIKVCKFGNSYKTKQKAYSVVFPKSEMTSRVNRFGQIEFVPAKTLFKVRCDYKKKR